jgi:putative phosphoribosyl transferase
MAARRVVLAVPTCAADSAERLASVADLVVSVTRPAHFVAVGRWYRNFDQTSDREVLDLLDRARQNPGVSTPRPPPASPP